MKQDYRKYLAYQNAPTVFLPVVVSDKPVKTFKSEDGILKAIYSVDPISNKPTGDISAYLSDKASPDVKAYIMQNLMQDMSSVANPAVPASLSDDDVLFFSRHSGESRDAYIQRISQFGQSNQQIVENARRNVPKTEPQPSAE